MLLLLNSLKCWCQNNVPLRGSELNDSVTAIISIDLLRQANIKLIERKYLIQENKAKDSLLVLKNDLIYIQNNKINMYNSHLTSLCIYNNELNNQISNYKKQISIYNSIGIGATIGIIVFILLR